MADIEKTINDLVDIEANMSFYKHPESAKVVRDAIELLKEQQKTIERLERDLAITQGNLNFYLNGNE